MKSFVVLSSLVVMLFAGCGEQKSNGGTSSISDRISAVASNVDSPSEVTKKFIKALSVDQNIPEARKLCTVDLADKLADDAKTAHALTDVKVEILEEVINISTKIINGKLNGGKATVKASISGNLNGRLFNDEGSYFYLRQVDGQWLMDRF